MSCTFDREMLSAYFDGELDPLEQAETERHISGCSACLRELGELKAAALAVKSLPRPRAPRAVAEGVSRGIAAAGPVRSFDAWRRRLSWAVAAAAALLVVYNVAYFTRTAPPGESAVAAKAPPVLAVAEGSAPADARKKQADAAPAKDGKPASAELQEERKAFADKDGQESLRRQTGADEKARSLDPKKPANALAEAAPGANRTKGDAPAAPAPKPEAKPALDALVTPAPRPAPTLPESAPLAKAEPKAAAAAAPPPAAPPAPLATTAGKTEKAKEAEAADAELRQRKDVDSYTVAAPGAARLRARTEALAASWKPQAKAVASGGLKAAAEPFGAAPEPLVLDVTPEQFEALKAELAKAGVELQPAPPAEDGRAEQGGRGGGAAKPADPEADRAAEKRESATRKASTPTRKITIRFLEAAPKK